MKSYSLIIAAAALLGCAYGYDIATEITRLNEIKFDPYVGPVEIFFNETKPSKDYIQIAFIEVVGGKESSTDTLLVTMKKKAQRLGAEAVISVKKSYKSRKGSSDWGLFDILFPSNSDSTNTEEEYSAPVLSGVAIVYKRNE